MKEKKRKGTNREIVKTFRCTKEEAKMLEVQAKETGLFVSEYIRSRVLENASPRLPPEVAELLVELKNQTIRVGTNVNQIARIANTFQFVTEKHYQELSGQLSFLSRQYERIYRLLLKEVKHGNHKTKKDQGG